MSRNNGTSTNSPPADAHISKDDGRRYWEGVDASVDGMLGGFPQVSRIDLQGSRNFLAKLGVGTKPGLRVVSSALEGGAGIGRVTEGLLLSVAEEVDVIEPTARFTAGLRGKPGVRDIFNVGLEDWRRPDGEGDGDAEGGRRYDLVWTQWCVGHLTDEQLVRYLERCRDALEPERGFIVVKENLSTSGADVFDELDSSVTREDSKFRSIFSKAGLKIVQTELQRGFPTGPYNGLLPVRMYALRPER